VCTVALSPEKRAMRQIYASCGGEHHHCQNGRCEV
jgi:hypothetical protein